MCYFKDIDKVKNINEMQMIERGNLTCFNNLYVPRKSLVKK